MLLCLCSSEHHWTILMNVWILVFSIAKQEGNVPWTCLQPILPLGAVNRFPRPWCPIRAPTLHQNTLRSRISVGPGIDAKHWMETKICKSRVLEHLDTRNEVNGQLYANINFVVARVMEAAKSWRAVYRWWLDLMRRSDGKQEKCTGGRIYLRS